MTSLARQTTMGLSITAAVWLIGACTTASAADSDDVFPPPDAAGGWRTLTDSDDIRRVAGCDAAALDEAVAFVQRTTRNGGLLVVRRGWLVTERYFGRGHREATANLASCGKSFTSVALGCLMSERPDLFPDGLRTRVFTPRHLPPAAFPLSDPRMADIQLGQLLAMTAGIRGNNPGSMIRGRAVTLDPAGPDGWMAMVDDFALGQQAIPFQGRGLGTVPLWCEPGGGYSYASASVHQASIVLRHVAEVELQEYVRTHLAEPLGWGRWGWGYRQYASQGLSHTPGAGGIVLRPTDMLRFGYLLLREGRWQDRQLIPADYVRHCGKPSPFNPHFDYSLQFDVNGNGRWPDLPRDAFWKTGSGGHALYVVPSQDLVVWKLGGRDGQYAPADTGLPVHPDAARAADERPGWKADPALDGETAYRETLRLVLAAIRE